MSRTLSCCFLLISLLLISACNTAPTPIPFGTISAQQVITAFEEAGLDVINVQREMFVGRDAPTTFSDRYIFEIGIIAPSGGQILVFDSNADMQAWRDYIESLRADRNTRRDVVYIYEIQNIMVQVNSRLPVDEANRFRDVVAGLP